MTLRMGWLWRVGRAYDPHLNGHWITVDTLMALNKELICTSHWEELSEAEAVFSINSALPRKARTISPVGLFLRKFSEACTRSGESDVGRVHAQWPTMHLLTLE